MQLQTELDEALKITRLAGELALRYFAQPVSFEEKQDLSPITVADRECEQLICRLLSERFPLDGILGEEGAFKESRSGRRWIIDPIDGTRDFVRGTPFWAVQLALEAQGQMALGVINLPCLQQVVHAATGAGCFWNHERIRAAETSRLDRAILLISGFQDAWQVWSAEQLRYLTRSCWTVRAYGACYDTVMLASGKADIWLSGNGMPWDYAPARVIAEECGAAFLTQDGTGRIDAHHCVVCAPQLRRIVCEVLKIPG
jgi:myo-inositol-1(or 4)-monophosphatase